MGWVVVMVLGSTCDICLSCTHLLLNVLGQLHLRLFGVGKASKKENSLRGVESI